MKLKNLIKESSNEQQAEKLAEAKKMAQKAISHLISANGELSHSLRVLPKDTIKFNGLISKVHKLDDAIVRIQEQIKKLYEI